MWAHVCTHICSELHCGVHVLYKLKECGLSEVAQVCEQILNQALGSLLSKTGTLVGDGSCALYSYREGEIRDRRLLPRREILGLKLGMGSTWLSIHA